MRTWNDRFFDALPVHHAWVGTGLAAILALAFVASVFASGELATFLESETRWWEDRNARIALLLALLAAYLPVARREESRSAARTVGALREVGLLGEAPPALARRRVWIGALLATTLVPLNALLVDRDPGLYFQARYWGAANLFIWSIGFAFAWNLGALLATVLERARQFRALANRASRVQVLRVDAFQPLGSYGLRCALLWSIALALWTINLVDRSFAASVSFAGLATVVGASAALLLPLRGVNERIRAAKAEEIDRVDAALSGDRRALAHTLLSGWDGPLSLADLLAYRRAVAEAREWPLDLSSLARFALYLAIPVGSWLGGALMERFVDALLGS